MANRLKEDEKNEKIIRNLLKLPDNRRCINCNSLGPQYVCTNFWTFICTNCSGIHREFTHRVKSISMAKFTSQEVSSLQGGGNASAEKIYLKEWDSQRNSLPDGSNVEKLRNFIKHVYVDRRYTGERSFDKPSRARTGETEEINEDRRLDTYQGGSRSPPYAGGRSPGYNQEKKQQGDVRKSPARPEIINDWRRGDRFGHERKSDEGRISDGGFSSGGKSPDLQKDLNVSSPPEVRPMRDILGDNVIPLQVIEPPKAENSKSLDGILHNQRTASTNSMASSNGNPAEPKTETSLIDFDAVPEPPVTVSVPQTQQSVASVPVIQQEIPSVMDNWANFDAVLEAKASQSSSISNPLDFVLSEFSIPTSLTGDGAPFMGTSVDNSAFVSVSASQMSQLDGFSLGGVLAAANLAPMPALSDNNGFANGTSGGQFHDGQQAQVHSVPSGIGSLATLPPSTQGMMMTPALKVTPEAGGRKELPEDLFMSAFPSWQTGTQYGSGVNLQYNMQTPLPIPLQPLNSANPFDVGNERTSVQASTFPSMTSLQGVLPSMETPSSLLHPSSDGANSATWLAQQPTHALSYSSVLPGPYSGPGDMLLRPQGIAALGFEGPGFGAINLNQQQGGFYSGQANQSTSSSIGGNPFG